LICPARNKIALNAKIRAKSCYIASMPLFRRAAPPKALELAIANPRKPVPYFLDALAQQEGYWKRRQREAEAVVDLGMHALATSMVERLQYADQYYVIGMDTARADSYDQAAECRRAALGAIGMSLMMRAINGIGDIEYVDAIAAGRHSATLITDMYDDNRGENGDDRLHIAAEAAAQIMEHTAAPEQWYKRGKLFVLCATPAQPTEALQFLDQIAGFENSYTEMVTMYPYMTAA
jgi:hypothetical protein